MSYIAQTVRSDECIQRREGPGGGRGRVIHPGGVGLGGGHLSRGNVVWGAVSSKSGGLDSVGGIEVVDLSKNQN